MAAIAKATKTSYDAESARRCVYISGLFSADKFNALDPVYIDSNGKVSPSDSTHLHFDGLASVTCDSLPNHPVTILGRGLICQWLEDSDNITPGTLLYIGAAGAMDTAASGGTAPIARAISDVEIVVLGPV